MSPRWNRSFEASTNVYCAVVETPAVSDPWDPRPLKGFQDLVPWADPYIVALVEKLRRSAACADDDEDALAELPPPVANEARGHDGGWPGGWTPRNWPHP